MNDAEYGATRERLLALAEKWLAALGLKWWSIETVYDREGADFAPNCLARTSVRWEYLQATMLWNMPLVATQTADELERTFVHECMHVFLHETRAGTQCECPWDIRHEERVATLLHKAVLWVWETAYEAGRASVPTAPLSGSGQTLQVLANGQLAPMGT